MKRTTVTLPDGLAEEVAREARRRRTSVSAVVRDSLEKQLGCEPGKRKLGSLIGILRSGDPDWASGLDEELERTWADDIRKSLGR